MCWTEILLDLSPSDTARRCEFFAYGSFCHTRKEKFDIFRIVSKGTKSVLCANKFNSSFGGGKSRSPLNSNFGDLDSFTKAQSHWLPLKIHREKNLGSLGANIHFRFTSEKKKHSNRNLIFVQ